MRILSSCLLMLVLAAGCIKSSDSTLNHSDPLKFEEGNLQKVLAGIDTLSLFRQALDRIGFTGLLETNNAYTLFAPGNAAMKAAGLDADKIKGLPLDSLRRIILFHIVPGALDNSALESLPVTSYMQTLRVDTILIPFQGYRLKNYWLPVQRGDKLYINGYGFNSPADLVASNGNIYPIGMFMFDNGVDESRTAWEVIEADPELSIFRDAITLLDSIKQSEAYLEYVFGFQLSPPVDIPVLSIRKSNPVNNTFATISIPTVLAPTNKAFQDAGFNSVDDLREFAYRFPFGVKSWANDDWSEIGFDFRYSSLDTLLARNFMINVGIADGGLRYPARILYSDLVKGRINNGAFNRMFRFVDGLSNTYLKYPHDLQFSQENGIAFVQWYPGSEKIMIPKDSDPKQAVNNFNVDNAVIYKVNKLFYPFN